ncbi:hypothetical protein R3P38DRAFT_3185320 [Favolaschia claudopus]|uniref:Uncharacterized protein n=1 Tax=Favolaschia claudopus TaxID=2862362 RepID=A0AAW0C7D9_9AGAR
MVGAEENKLFQQLRCDDSGAKKSNLTLSISYSIYLSGSGRQKIQLNALHLILNLSVWLWDANGQ